MAKFELIMPKMGESIVEATILNWVKKEGDAVEEDETILEIATDKVDSEVPSPVNGVIKEIKFKENDVVAVGEVIAVIATEADVAMPDDEPVNGSTDETVKPEKNGHSTESSKSDLAPTLVTANVSEGEYSTSSRFYSPLVKNIAKRENIGLQELEQIPGTGQQGRVTKKDILSYLKNRSTVKNKTTPNAKPAPVSKTYLQDFTRGRKCRDYRNGSNAATHR